MSRRLAGAGAVALCLTVGGAMAQTDRIQPDFTFRSVSAPTGAGPRITTQIDPSAPSAIRAPNPPEPDGDAIVTTAAPLAPVAAVPGTGGHDWFWAAVSPRREDTGPGRLEAALRAIDGAPTGQRVAAPRMQAMQDIAAAHGSAILMETVGTRVSPALVLAVISVESGGRTEAVSGAGAAGLMQLMPATAERFGVTDRMAPGQSIAGGVAYLDWLLEHFVGDPILALAGYNAGEGSVRDAGGVPPYAETRGYVPKVLAAWAVARGMCVTPPVLIGDGCVFTVNNL